MKTERLGAIPLFAGLSAEELEAVCAVAGEVDVAAGDAVTVEATSGTPSSRWKVARRK